MNETTDRVFLFKAQFPKLRPVLNFGQNPSPPAQNRRNSYRKAAIPPRITVVAEPFFNVFPHSAPIRRKLVLYFPNGAPSEIQIHLPHSNFCRPSCVN